MTKAGIAGIGRRDLLKLAAGAAALDATGAWAADVEIVLANFGGAAAKATSEVYAAAFNRMNAGAKVRVDGGGPTSGKIKAIVESGKISWDMVDRNFHGSLELGPLGLLEPVDYSIVDRNKILPGYAGKWGVGSYTYANVLAWNTKALKGRKPRGWADFWNVKDFPGKRTVRKYIDGVLEAALMADGVPIDKLYPLDTARAFKKVRDLKNDLLFWNTHAECMQMLREGEVSMACMAHSNAEVLKNETRGEIDYTFNQGSLFVSGWAVLKGSPAGRKNWEFIASTQDPAKQVEMLKRLGWGPINPAANKLVPPELAASNPSDPRNLAVMAKADNEWYAQNSSAVLKRFFDEVVA